MFQAHFVIIPAVELRTVYFYICNSPIIKVFEKCLEHCTGQINLGKRFMRASPVSYSFCFLPNLSHCVFTLPMCNKYS